MQFLTKQQLLLFLERLFQRLERSKAWHRAVQWGLVRDGAYFERYLDRYDRRHRGSSLRPMERVVEHLQSLALWIILVYFVSIWWLEPSLSHLDNLLLHNIVHMEGLGQAYNLTLAAITALALYLSPLVNGHWNFGLMAHHWRHCGALDFAPIDSSDSNESNSGSASDDSTIKSKSTIVRHLVTLAVLNAFHLLCYYCFAFYLVTYEGRVWYHLLFEQPQQFDSLLMPNAPWLFYIGQLAMCPIVFTVALPFIRVYVLYGTLGMIAVLIGRHLLETNIHLAREWLTLTRLSGVKLRRFRVFNLQVLRGLTDLNRTLGKGFFAFLGLITPLNASMWNMLYFYRYSWSVTVLFTILAVTGFAIQFVLQLVICRLAARIHVPASDRVGVLGLLPKKAYWSERVKQSLRLQLRLAIYLEQFHTTRPYTVTYGRFGAITYGGIKISAVQYWKLLVFYFKLWS